MLTRTFSATIEGITPTKIEIEIESTQGMPGCIIIGLPSLAVMEAKERITAALASCGVPIKAKRTIINLAPADVRKTSSHLELGIAVGILKHYGLVTKNTNDTLFLGELSLDGTIKPIRGALSLVLAAAQFGFKKVVLPAANVCEVAVINQITIHPLTTLAEYLTSQTKGTDLPTASTKPYTETKNAEIDSFPYIIGQEQALRALTIAAAGKHSLLFIGPPGAGKSVLARSLQGLLPELGHDEALAVTQLHSLAGLTSDGLVTRPPFRSPHHTTSLAGLLGGGNPFQPGELSLAHYGVIFLDELPEFSRNCLEALREPLETHTITVSRAAAKYILPADSLLIAAANPCPCGYLGSETTACRCSLHAQQTYVQKFSGPLLDRIDMQVWVQPVDPEKLIHEQGRRDMAAVYSELKMHVHTARKRQMERFKDSTHRVNSQILGKDIRTYCTFSPDARILLITAARKLKLSPRAIHACIRIAQTITDLSGEEMINASAIAEAVQYRQQLIPDVLH